MNGQNVWKRLAEYALPFRKQIVGALLLLLLGTAAELAGPFLAKVMIDNHILAIHKTWYRFEQQPLTAEGSELGVQLADRYYIREDWLGSLPADQEKKGSRAQIVTEGTSYYMLDRELTEEGEPRIEPLSASEGRDRVEATLVRSGQVIDRVQGIRLTADEVKSLYSSEIPPILLLAGGYAALILLSALCNYIQILTLQTTAQRIIQRMRMILFTHLQKLPVSYFDKTPVGQIVSRVSNDTEAIRELYVSVLATFVQNGVYLIGILIALFILQPQLALFCFLSVPLLIGLVITYRYYSSRYYTIIRSRLSDLNATINEMIQNMTIVQALRREAGVRAEFEKVNEEYFQTRIKENNLESLLLRPAVDLIWKIALTVIIWYFGSASFHSVISFGALFAFVDYIGRFFEPINMIMNRLSQLQQAAISSQRVFDILDTPAEEKRDGQDMQRPRGEVVFEHVSFAYQNEQYVLKDVSFTAKPGQTVALVGHTGSGKSSLMNLLLGFYPVTRGRILIDGQDMREMDTRMLRKHVGLVLQDPFLFTGSIGFNIRLYKDEITAEEVQRAARAVKADDFISGLPQGYDEPVVERGMTLSAGQRQLLSFSRALAADPAILILDEATASIDSETESSIQEALHVLSEGRTTFIIAHRLSTIQHADLILVLSRGEVVERGTHDELMEQKGLYQKMYQLQQRHLSATVEQ
ncbi:ABC transporter ATP-binding protein/permease [Brevibacillus ruminantium]|uniref:ABC transporter ATP-binding protein/permease n=1 Tax=Brevibacillus ruminantium TaxID=2950604 RepID=A0ABY4WJ54_9BACL|nr:ABC transporter ATP-binding protein [Brevibacillus ruminantium]USG66734.1 ABC transporter ATP-binding protein/permease [Brevibacillus ruminantium]